jgi:hypothetical protein
VEPDAGPAATGSRRAWVAPEAPAEAAPRAASGPSAPAPTVPDTAAPPDGPPPLPFGPMTLSDLLDGAFVVIRHRPRAVLGAAAAVVVPLQVIAVLVQRAVVDTDELATVLTGGPLLPGATGGTFVGALVVGLLQSLLLFFLGAVVATFVSAWYAGDEVDGRQALRASVSHSGALVAAWLLLTPLKAVSYALCVLPLAVTVTFFALTAPAIVVERLGPIAGIKRSAQLVSRQFWRCLGIVLLSALVESVLQSALTIIPTIVAVLVPESIGWILLAVGQAAAGLLTLTALVAVSVLLYFDLRMRTEGLDIELRARDAYAAGT